MEWVREGNRWKIQREQVLTTTKASVPNLRARERARRRERRVQRREQQLHDLRANRNLRISGS